MLSPLLRRDFLALAGVGVAAAALPASAFAAPPADLIAGIDQTTLKRGRTGGEPSWFHPRVCMVPGADGPTAFMTLQPIMGSDFYGPVHFMTSRDLGKSWTDPQPVPPLGRLKQPDGAEEGVCDVVPEWHEPSKSVLAVGHNVYYSGPKFSTDQPPRWPVYAVWKDGQWGPRQRLKWSDPRGAYVHTNGCGQRVTLPNGDILLALSFGAEKKQPRSVAGALCSFDGKTLAIKKVGEELQHPKGRGLLEPSLARFQDRLFMTLRAEDQRGYVCVGADGLKWEPKRPWAWDDGEPLTMSTTQQHWLVHSEALFLVYTRKHESNLKVFRWRAPLFLAQVDVKALRLIRETERIVLPLVGDGLKAPDDVPYGGNFHPVNASPGESWITDGQVRPKHAYQGDLLLARIRWRKANGLG